MFGRMVNSLLTSLENCMVHSVDQFTHSHRSLWGNRSVLLGGFILSSCHSCCAGKQPSWKGDCGRSCAVSRNHCCCRSQQRPKSCWRSMFVYCQCFQCIAFSVPQYVCEVKQRAAFIYFSMGAFSQAEVLFQESGLDPREVRVCPKARQHHVQHNSSRLLCSSIKFCPVVPRLFLEALPCTVYRQYRPWVNATEGCDGKANSCCCLCSWPEPTLVQRS